jgi:hypothetical protein
MAKGIRKVGNDGDNVYATEWYREQVAKAERGNREHIAKYERSFNGIMAKADADADEDDGDVNVGASDHHASTVADLLVESGKYPHRAAALDHLLNSPHGNALLARMHKAAEQTAKETPMTSHSEFVQSVVKQYGIVALAKSMVQDQKSYGLDEPTFTRLATEHAQRIYSNDRPDVAFSKFYQSEESVRRACQIAKSMPFVADLTPLVVGGDPTQNVDNPAEAIEQLKQLGRDRWPSARASDQFERALTDPANAALARRAVPRPQPTTSFPWPR